MVGHLWWLHPGAPIVSDPVDLKVEPLSELAVSIFLPDRTALTSVHWDGVQTAYISEPGDFVSAETFKAESTLTKRLFLSEIQVDATPTSRAIVFFGDSITDGNCSTVDANNRWPDHIAERLQKSGHKDVCRGQPCLFRQSRPHRRDGDECARSAR